MQWERAPTELYCIHPSHRYTRGVFFLLLFYSFFFLWWRCCNCPEGPLLHMPSTTLWSAKPEIKIASSKLKLPSRELRSCLLSLILQMLDGSDLCYGNRNTPFSSFRSSSSSYRHCWRGLKRFWVSSLLRFTFSGFINVQFYILFGAGVTVQLDNCC